MQFGTKTGTPEKARTQCVIVGVYENDKFSDSAKLLDAASKGSIKKVLGRGDMTGKAGQTLMLHDLPNITAPRVLIVGLGDIETTSGPKFILIAKAMISALSKSSAKNALCCLLDSKAGDETDGWKTRRIVEQCTAGIYNFTEMRSKPPESNPAIETIDILVTKPQLSQVRRAIVEGSAISAGVDIAKDLGNMPPNICTPTYLADQAKLLAKNFSSLTTKVLEEKDMEKLGMGSFLSVSKGSVQPGKMIIIEHKGAKNKKDAPHVIVGKGITFDTGGISLKPPGTMYEMTYDMCGAASVFGAMRAVAELALPLNVVCVIAAAENMPSGIATRPGDIVKSMSGQTIEILNTDAEGRLVLCDALTYVEKFKPASVIDVATLTGAVVMALGSHPAALYANDDQLADDINKAGENTRDRVWRMPLWEEYQPQLNSAFADMANIGGREAGSVTAACFLARFTKKYRWAHLDIAGIAYKAAGSVKGSTGRPVALLTQYLIDRSKKSA
jgi:leucyl aminopeptidase